MCLPTSSQMSITVCTDHGASALARSCQQHDTLCQGAGRTGNFATTLQGRSAVDPAPAKCVWKDPGVQELRSAASLQLQKRLQRPSRNRKSLSLSQNSLTTLVVCVMLRKTHECLALTGCRADVRTIKRPGTTMFSPTGIGSPLRYL